MKLENLFKWGKILIFFLKSFFEELLYPESQNT